MAAHEHRILRVHNGKLTGQVEQDFDCCELEEGAWRDDPYAWAQPQVEYVDDSDEFTDCADGFYWQWRRVRYGEVLGEPMGPLNGPFPDEDTARAHEADPANAHCGMAAVFGGKTGGFATTGPFCFDNDPGESANESATDVTDDVIRPLADAHSYRVPQSNPGLHRELAWFVTGDDRILGVLIEDQVDYDFSWVVLALDAPTGNYRAIDVAASCPTAAIATSQLQATMRAWFAKPQHAVVEALR